MSSKSANADAIVTLEGKVLLVGDMSVGKTSLVNQFTRGNWIRNVEPSVGAAYSRQTVRIDDSLIVKFNIWDTAGQERFRAINRLYYRGAAAAILVFSVNDKGSFGSLPYWAEQVRAHAADNVILAIAANKADLGAERHVSPEEGKAQAEALGAIYHETSAKTGTNVAEIFSAIARTSWKAKENGGFKVVRVDNESGGVSLKPGGRGQGGGGCQC